MRDVWSVEEHTVHAEAEAETAPIVDASAIVEEAPEVALIPAEDIVAVTETLMQSGEVNLEEVVKPASMQHLEREFHSMGRSKAEAKDLMRKGIHSATC